MGIPSSVAGRMGGRFAAIIAVVAIPAHAVLFPEPLHLVRQIDEPISGARTTIHQYCSGDRVVTVSGSRVVIADHGRQELIEIDRAAATFSITSFGELARAAQEFAPRRAAAAAVPEGKIVEGRRSADGRPLETIEYVQSKAVERVVVTVSVDRQVPLTFEAVEALIGAAFPNQRSFIHEAMLRAAAAGSAERRMQTAARPAHALPSEHSVAVEAFGEQVTFRSAVIALERQQVPPELLTIPPGARRVESKQLTMPRVMREIESLPPPSQ